jgi:eukaryotic-like serine/threonine-protein kinase
MDLSPGAVIAQRYQLERLLGEGGMGTVWAAKHVLTQKRVALKFLKEAPEPELVRRFVREARAASAVRHPNVIGVHDVIMLDDGLPTMVMDLLEGESLAARLERAGALAPAELSSIMAPVLSAVGAAHALGIVHRDLKPDNVFLARVTDSGEVRPMVLDFGICKLMSPEALMSNESTLTRTGSVMGTPYYMAPEQVFGERDVDARADVWAIGVMLYECCTGQRPFEGENIGQLIKKVLSGSYRPLRELAPQVPATLVSAIGHMLAYDRAQRAPDLREAFEVLRTTSVVSAQSFGAAAKLRISPSEVPPGTTRPREPSTLAASAAGNPVSWNIDRRPNRSLPWLAGLGLVLVGAGSTVLLRSTVLAPSAAAPAVSSRSVAAPPSVAPAAVVSPAPPASTAPPAPSVAASGRPRTPSAKPQASSGSPKPAPRTLAGGVHGDVPF